MVCLGSFRSPQCCMILFKLEFFQVLLNHLNQIHPQFGSYAAFTSITSVCQAKGTIQCFHFWLKVHVFHLNLSSRWTQSRVYVIHPVQFMHKTQIYEAFFIVYYYEYRVYPRHGQRQRSERTLELFNYRLESRPLSDPCSQSLCLDLELTQNWAQPRHFI